MKTGTCLLVCALAAVASAFSQTTVTHGVASVAPASAPQGTSGLIVTFTLSAGLTPPVPPAGIAPTFADGRIKGYPRDTGPSGPFTEFCRYVRGNPGYGRNNFTDHGDGHTEAQELAAGTDPLDARSVLQVQPSPGAAAGLAIAWAAVPGRGYVVQSATNLLGPWLDLPTTATNATSSAVQWLLASPSGGIGFYRVRVFTP